MKEKVLQSIAESLGIAVDAETKLVDVADSMEVAQLVLDLESDFHIEITDDDLKKIFTVQDIVIYVDSYSHAL